MDTGVAALAAVTRAASGSGVVAVAGPRTIPDVELIRILIVDDEPKNLVVLETVLDVPGYQLVKAASGDEALLALVTQEFALLILDIRMPGMTGFELAQIIKARKRTSRVPIIFLTAYYNEDQHVLEGYGSGAVDYLHKPVNPGILRSKVAVFAELHRAQRERDRMNGALLAEVEERARAEAGLRELNEDLDRRVLESTRALRDADRRKDEFLATLAHELRNPLAPVRNAARILHLRGTQQPELQTAAAVVERQTRHMSRLIDELMDVSRINRGSVVLTRERIELAQLLELAIETSRPMIDDSRHSLNVAAPPHPVFLDVDLARLSQVVCNLLNNAAKYTPPGGRIELDVQECGQELVLTVRDDGIGIGADKLAGIFEMFAQVEDAVSRAKGGLGIGLYLARRLVELHHGSIEARSEGPGKGCEFVVRLPTVEGAELAARPSAFRPSVTASPRRVLVVDDNRDAATSAAMLVEMMGNEVRTAFDGEDAVRLAAEFRPDVILLDIGLPGMNGYQAARLIREQYGNDHIVLVAVTGWGQARDRELATEAGFDHHMVKPVDPQALTDFLAALDPAR